MVINSDIQNKNIWLTSLLEEVIDVIYVSSDACTSVENSCSIGIASTDINLTNSDGIPYLYQTN